VRRSKAPNTSATEVAKELGIHSPRYTIGGVDNRKISTLREQGDYSLNRPGIALMPVLKKEKKQGEHRQYFQGLKITAPATYTCPCRFFAK